MFPRSKKTKKKKRMCSPTQTNPPLATVAHRAHATRDAGVRQAKITLAEHRHGFRGPGLGLYFLKLLSLTTLQPLEEQYVPCMELRKKTQQKAKQAQR